MLVQTIKRLDLFMLFIKTTPTKQSCLVFFCTQRSPVRLLEARWHNHTPEYLKCERGEKRGVYERAKAIHRTIHVRKVSNQKKKAKKLKKQEKKEENS